MIYLGRHGETEYNRQGRLQGRIGGTLTERGQAQARALGCLARELGVGRVVSSGLSRAAHTARLVAAKLGRVAEADERLAELDCGACSGLTREQIEQRFPGLLAARRRDPWHHRWPDGESLADAVARVRPALEALLLLPDNALLVIAHQGVNRAILQSLTNMSVEEAVTATHPWRVMLRFDGVAVAHCWLSEGEPSLATAWQPGPCRSRSAPANPR